MINVNELYLFEFLQCFRMVRNRQRKTDRRKSSGNLEMAVNDVRERGISVRQAALDNAIPRTCLQRYMNASTPEKLKMGSYIGVSHAHSVFNCEQAKQLSDYIKTVDNLFHGLSSKQCREFAYQYASGNKLPTMPNSWEKNKIAG